MPDVLLSLAMPTDVAQLVEDLLLSRPDLVHGFTSSHAEGHGSAATLVEPAELVAGHSARVIMRMVGDDEAMRELLRLIEERSRLLELLDKTSAGASVSVNLTEGMPGIAGCSLVASPYSAFSSAHGTLAVLGPVRMNYARIVPMVDFAAQILSQCLKSRC